MKKLFNVRYFLVLGMFFLASCGGSGGSSSGSSGDEAFIQSVGSLGNCEALPRQGIGFISQTSSVSHAEPGLLQGAWSSNNGQVVALAGTKNAWTGDLVEIVSVQYVFDTVDTFEYSTGCGDEAVTNFSAPQYDENGSINGQSVFVSGGVNFSHQGPDLVLISLRINFGNGFPQTVIF